MVGVRISLSDFIPGALDIEDAIRVAQTLEADGQLDYVNVTAAGYHNIFQAIEPSDEPDGYLVDLTAQVKAAVSELPVFTVGGIKDPALAEEILASGKADMVAMTRAQIADPEFANKVQRGPRGRDRPLHPRQPGLHRPRLQGAADQLHRQPGRGPRGTAAAARRGRGAGALARRRRRPGGDEGRRDAGPARPLGHAARARGALGGQVNLILRTPGRDEFGWITRDLEVQLRKAGVEVRLGTEATADARRPSSRRTA